MDNALAKQADIGNLITHIGKNDNHLYQALKKLSSAVASVATVVTKGSSPFGWFEIPVDPSGNALPVPSNGYTQVISATQAIFVENVTDRAQTSWILRIVQDGTGGWEVVFDTGYVGISDLAIITEPNTRTMIHFTTRPDGICEMNFFSTGLAI